MIRTPRFPSRRARPRVITDSERREDERDADLIERRAKKILSATGYHLSFVGEVGNDHAPVEGTTSPSAAQSEPTASPDERDPRTSRARGDEDMSAAVSMTETTALARLATETASLEYDSAVALRTAFEAMFAQADEWTARARTIVVTREDQTREMKLARESRLALKAIRVNAEKTRKRLKEDCLRRGKAIDGIYNVLEALVEPIEEHLLEQETFAQRAEASRRDALAAARAEALRAYGTDPAVYSALGLMSEETWSGTLNNARLAHEGRLEAARQTELARLEAERIAAERRETERKERIRLEAERAERERLQAAENARLKREAEEREAVARAEREAAAAERAKLEASARAAEQAAATERARIEAEARSAREAAEAEARKAREEADRAAAALEAERRAAREREEAAAKAERERVAKEEAARAAASLAPDREKIAHLAASIRSIEIPTMATERGKAAMAKIVEQFGKIAAWLDKTREAL